MKAKAVLFDLDDTLYEYAPCNRHALAAAREVLGGTFEVPEQEGQRAVDRSGLGSQAESAQRVVEGLERSVGIAQDGLGRRALLRHHLAFRRRVRPART